MTEFSPAAGQRGSQNGMGIASMVLGILGLVMCLGYVLVLPILAVIFGVIGRRKADEGLASNRGMATAGLVMGIVGLAIGAIWWILAILGTVASPMFGN